jgi:RTX calcium-binding nonapeptide repeat (4 copies)
LGAEGVRNDDGLVTAVSTIFADQSNNSFFNPVDFSGEVLATNCLFESIEGTDFDPGSAANITEVDPSLGPLQNNGGPTETHALLVGSPALDTGINPLSLAFDQRGAGFFRQSGPGVDIGAFELQLPPGAQLLFDPQALELVLSIEGRSSRDRVVISLASSGQLLRVDFNGKISTFPTSQVARILIFGRDGNDELRLESNVNVPALIDGGDGADVIKGGAAADILLGQAGDDQVYGFGGRDLLIGGNGKDTEYGGADDDLLVGGLTVYDGDHVALHQILAQWNGGADYPTRVDDSQAGTNAPQLTAAEIIDKATDKLFGQSGLDLFYRAAGDTTDRAGIEIIITLM